MCIYQTRELEYCLYHALGACYISACAKDWIMLNRCIVLCFSQVAHVCRYVRMVCMCHEVQGDAVHPPQTLHSAHKAHSGLQIYIFTFIFHKLV